MFHRPDTPSWLSRARFRQPHHSPADVPFAAAPPFRIAVGRAWTDDGLCLRFVLPAVREEDVALTTDDRHLRLTGRRRTPAFLADDPHAVPSLHYGSFERIVALPAGLDADGVRHRFHHGVLDVLVPYGDRDETGAAASARTGPPPLSGGVAVPLTVAA